jgi:hypothetical protein
MALRRFAVAVSMALAALLAMPGVVRGQGPAEPLARSLTADQLDAFVELTGDAKPLVWQRLLADPGLVRYAAAAADARLERRASGKTMTIVGFTVLGVGAAAGYGLFLWGLSQGICDYGTSCHANERMVRPSEAENEASGRYQTPGLPPMPGYPTPYPHSLRLRPAGTLVSAPILTLTF